MEGQRSRWLCHVLLRNTLCARSSGVTLARSFLSAKICPRPLYLYTRDCFHTKGVTFQKVCAWPVLFLFFLLKGRLGSHFNFATFQVCLEFKGNRTAHRKKQKKTTTRKLSLQATTRYIRRRYFVSRQHWIRSLWTKSCLCSSFLAWHGTLTLLPVVLWHLLEPSGHSPGHD